jgi:uncharacterized protein YbjT (DUF2867 family)
MIAMLPEATKLSVIVTGATGMVGEGVLLECLEHPAIGQVLMVNRKPYPAKHPKLSELIVPDFLHLDGFADRLTGYDACFYCAGISSRGMSESDYTHVTYDVTIHFAQTLASLNQKMVFDYVSGSLTDSSEKGRIMWARVKGRTENALLRLPFAAAYMFRPGLIQPLHGVRPKAAFYRVFYVLFKPLLPLLRRAFPNHVLTTEEIGRAMLLVARHGYEKHILETRDIRAVLQPASGR